MKRKAWVDWMRERTFHPTDHHFCDRCFEETIDIATSLHYDVSGRITNDKNTKEGASMLKEFFGINGYTRRAEGFLSWQHLVFVSLLMVAMFLLAVVFGRRNRGKNPQISNRVLAVAAVLMNAVEIAKILIRCFAEGSWTPWLGELPLYMCSIQLITLPLAAFSKGRLKEAALDFVSLFGVLGAVLGTYCAGNNYSCYPVLSFDNVFSGITHSVAGFASVYIMIAGLAKMHRHNMGIACAIIIGFGIVAYAVNLVLGTNYMFLMRGDGTPYDILYRLLNGHRVLYPLGVVGLFLIYIFIGFQAAQRVRRMRDRKEKQAC